MRQTKDNPIQGQPKSAEQAKPAEQGDPVKTAPAKTPPVKGEVAPANAEQVKPDAGKPLDKAARIEAAPKLDPDQFPGQVPIALPPPKEAAPKPAVGDFIEPALWLIGALLLGALVFWAFSRWRRRQESGDDASEQLTQFRESYEQGEMTEEEYKRVHALLANKLQGKMRPAQPLPPDQKPASGGPADSPK